MGVDRYTKLLVLCYVPRPEHLASVDEQSRLSAITVQVNSRPCTDLYKRSTHTYVCVELYRNGVFNSLIVIGLLK